MASMGATADQVVPLHPESPDQRALKDYWSVYEAHFDEIQAGIMRELEGDPDFAAIVKMTPRDVQEQNAKKSRAMTRRAIVDGDWAPYWADLREQGAIYAKMGLSFRAWFKAVGTFRTILSPYLFEAYGKTPQRLLAVIEAMTGLMDRAMAVIGEAYLETKEKTIRQQQDSLRELSTPVLQVRDKMLLLPVIGVIDSHRAQQLTEELLLAIRANRARVVVLDITGVPAVDSRVANHLVQTVEAARLMGAAAIVTGLSAEVAQTLVTLGVELSKLNTVGDLQGGLEEAEHLLGYRVIRDDPESRQVNAAA
jgi:anti-anti-sigma regulatory factor